MRGGRGVWRGFVMLRRRKGVGLGGDGVVMRMEWVVCMILMCGGHRERERGFQKW